MTFQEQDTAHRGWRISLVPLMILWFLAIIFSWFFPERGALLLSHIATPVLLLFSGAWLYRRGKALYREEVLLLALAAWYIITRILNGAHYLETDYDFICQLIATACIAFPLGQNLPGARRNRALKVLAGVIAAVFSVIAWIAVFASVSRTPFQLPGSSLIIGVNEIYSNPARLNILNMHPNVSGAILCLGLGLTLYLCAALRSKWRFVFLIPAAIGLFGAVALTLSRTAMIMLSCQLGGFAFLILMKKLSFPRRWFKPALSLLAFVVVAAVTFAGLYYSIYGMDIISRAWVAGIPTVTVAKGETAQAQDSPASEAENAGSIVDESRLGDNVYTFAGRLDDIYPVVIPVLQNRPLTLLIGNATRSVITQANRLTGRNLYHWHNSLIQTLMTVGLPGLLIALLFSVLVIVQCVRLMFSGSVPLSVQVLALPVVSVLLHSMLENFLFMNVSILNLLFTLLCGFLFAYGRELKPRLRSRKAARS